MAPSKDTIIAKKIDGLASRIATVEIDVGSLKSADKEHNDRLTRIDERLKIMGEIALQNNESQQKSITEIKALIDSKHTATLEFVKIMCLELQQPIDLLLNSLGVNEDAKAPGRLRENLHFLDKLHAGREETVKRIWNILVQAGVWSLLGLLASGFGVWVLSKAGVLK